MKILNSVRKQSGVGLIEVLIVLVVLVLAWAAIAALQGKLMSGSSVSKARNEALELAREKTEEMRNSIEKGQYVADLVDTSGARVDDPIGTIAGVNANFTRSWILGDVDMNGDGVPEDYAKQLSMQVSWPNNEGATESVVLNSIITFTSKLAMLSSSTPGAGGGGNGLPNQDWGSEGPAPDGTDIPDGTLDEEGGPGINDNLYITPANGDGYVYLYQGSAAAGNVVFTAYGGKIIKIAGTIYYDSTEPYIRATSPSYCTSFVKSQAECGIDNSSSINCVRYVCYAAGDCKHGGEGCPDNTDNLPDLNGGWYGKMGDFFPTLPNPQQYPTICMGDSIDIPARLYVTERVNDGSITGYEREGINASFDCNDVLISTHNDTACDNLITELTGYGIHVSPNATPSEIENHEVIRPLAADAANIVLAATNDAQDNGVFPNFCTSASLPGGPEGNYTCSCHYQDETYGVISVHGWFTDTEEPNIGCCSLEDCTANLPVSPVNNSDFEYTCDYVAVP